MSEPLVLTSTPTITWLSQSLAYWALYAGLNPPSAIFMTVASASVLEARASSALLPLRRLIASSSGSRSSALCSRCCISRRARCWAAALRRLSCAGSASICSLSSRTRARASSRLSCRLALRRNEAAPALARTRTPSCATHSSFTAPAVINAARLALSNSSSAAPCATRKSDRLW